MGIEPDPPPFDGTTVLKTAGATRPPDTPEYEQEKDTMTAVKIQAVSMGGAAFFESRYSGRLLL